MARLTFGYQPRSAFPFDTLHEHFNRQGLSDDLEHLAIISTFGISPTLTARGEGEQPTEGNL